VKKLTYEIKIKSSAKRTWDTLIGKETYEKWVKAFTPGSTFKGEWKKGEEVKFFDPSMGGTVAKLIECEPCKLIEANHIATLNKDMQMETTGPMTEKWIGTTEVYKLSGEDGFTNLAIEMETHEDFEDMFNSSWPKALENIKELAEKTN